MKTLKINADLAKSDLVKTLSNLSDELIEKFYADAKKYLSKKAKTEIEVDRSNYDEISGMIKSRVAFKGHALLESFGKGSSMDTGSEYLFDYMGGELWNPARSSIVITGRPKGEYTDFFGSTRYSEGNFEGLPIENKVRPRKPTYSIQNAEKWFLEENGEVERAVDLALDEYFRGFKKYLIYG